jgi:hypothetical protein
MVAYILWAAGIGAAVGAVAGALSGKGAIRGAISGANILGNSIEAVGYLSEGNPGMAGAAMAGISGHDGLSHSGGTKPRSMDRLQYVLYGAEDWSSREVGDDMSRDIIGAGLTIGLGLGVQYGGSALMQMMSSGGMMFTMGRYAEDVKTAIEQDSNNVIIVEDYGPVYGAREIESGDPDRHDQDIGESEEYYQLSAQENFGDDEVGVEA